MALRPVADIEEQIKKLREQIKKRHEREAKHVAKIAEQSGLLERDISDETLLKEFAAIAARFPKKA
ncbi:TraC-like protein [Ochrobactrum sp. BH3]|nr:TraC-like protein [Ochrobactrum sp. BH3]